MPAMMPRYYAADTRCASGAMPLRHAAIRHADAADTPRYRLPPLLIAAILLMPLPP